MRIAARNLPPAEQLAIQELKDSKPLEKIDDSKDLYKDIKTESDVVENGDVVCILALASEKFGISKALKLPDRFKGSAVLLNIFSLL
ncbi:hypothetical protein EVAR_73205_1 [Eumeta japonica]|uniref:Uncharacterized protein n=1 Tax=Eumeta variegata TaxID=151549 RepID=A0A4C1T758_EUMVA|nr:hypothetical protein EVAR_73205_1 [Eumeta japonica]